MKNLLAADIDHDAEFWSDQPSSKGNLRHILGDDGYLRLIEAYAGTRVFVPINPLRSSLVDEITIQHATKLSEAMGGMFIRVPLDREFRVIRYSEMGFSNAKIARLCGVTETAVNKIRAKLRLRDAG